MVPLRHWRQRNISWSLYFLRILESYFQLMKILGNSYSCLSSFGFMNCRCLIKRNGSKASSYKGTTFSQLYKIMEKIAYRTYEEDKCSCLAPFLYWIFERYIWYTSYWGWRFWRSTIILWYCLFPLHFQSNLDTKIFLRRSGNF